MSKNIISNYYLVGSVFRFVQNISFALSFSEGHQELIHFSTP